MHRRRRRRKGSNKIIIISSLCLLLVLTAGYAAFQTNLKITAKGNIKQQTRVIQSWSKTDQTDFHSDYYKQNIVSMTFLDNNNVPSNATESWNVSQDKENGGVMAWVIPSSSDNTKYDLYIGARGGVIANEDSSYLFYNFRGISNLNFNNNFDTRNAVNMRNMFCFCTNLTTIDLSGFDTRNVTQMNDMFLMFHPDGYVLENKLTNIIFGENWTTENVTNMGQMFTGCNKLTSLDVSNWNTSNVITMASVFALCTNLSELDISHWDTSRVTSMANMFQSCKSLTDLDLSRWDTSNVTDMSVMFQATNFTSLNLCSFNTKKVTNMFHMFAFTTNLKNIYVSPNWTTVNADTTGLFYESPINSVTTGRC